ncbi:MAG: rod shape-determining protein RodA, partial [Bacteroidales bacterium]|nr:rod shape-determining protein RodA [Bacteroidales bacterium]
IIVIFILDAKFFPFFAYPLYGIMLIMLVALFIFGREINGAKSWFVMGGFRLQPSEFAKPFTALALARLLSSHGFNLKKFKSLFHALTIIFVPALLILLQPDLGSTLIYFAFILVLYREGFSQNTMILGAILIVLFILTLLINKSVIILSIWLVSLLLFMHNASPGKVFLGIFLPGATLFAILFGLNQLPVFGLSLDHVSFISFAGISLITLANIIKLRKPAMYKVLAGMVIAIFFVFTVDYAMNNILKEHQRQRIYVTIGIEDDPQGVGYNLNQSKIAIGSGGFSGKGFLEGTQTKLQFVPEQSTDFIFCTVGEEWGFIGTSIVVLLFVLLILRLIVLAERQRSLFSRIFGYGLASVILMHFIVNIGMTIGLLPVIGIPLPFFSYGGSSLMAFTLFLYIFIKLDSNRKELLR